MVRLSVVITAYNEEKNIEECLKSVKHLADEIVVVDNQSTDKTKSIAQKYTKKVFSQKNDPQKIDLQKNFGFSKATGDWILSLDADERITSELEKEIKAVLSSSDVTHPPLPGTPPMEGMRMGYWIPRKNIIFGKWIEHTGWYPDYQLRLFRKGKGKYTGKHVHEDLQVTGNTANLQHPLIHQHYQTINQFILRSLIYIPNEADNVLKKDYTFNYLDAVIFPIREFLSRFFAREGYKDGLHGLVLSCLMAWYHFTIFATMWEKQKFLEVNNYNFLDTIEKESKKRYKELLFWFYNEKIKQSRSLPERYLLKVKRKLS